MVDELEDGSVTHCAIHEKLVKQKRKQLQMLAHTHTRVHKSAHLRVYSNTGPKDAVCFGGLGAHIAK